MIDKPTGVFVRLPLSEEQVKSLEYRLDGYNSALLAIGTPVTGGELEVVAYDNLASGHLSRVKPVGPNINLVRQSDALAKLAERYNAGWVAGKRDAHLSYTRQIAEKDAEIARYRKVMEEAQEYARKGSWSRAHVVLHKALKGPEA